MLADWIAHNDNVRFLSGLTSLTISQELCGASFGPIIYRVMNSSSSDQTFTRSKIRRCQNSPPEKRGYQRARAFFNPFVSPGRGPSIQVSKFCCLYRMPQLDMTILFCGLLLGGVTLTPSILFTTSIPAMTFPSATNLPSR